jgi:hypothetical protein
MQEAQANLKQAAVDFLAAAEGVAVKAAQAPADPLDQVDLSVPSLGDLEPAISAADLADLQQRLAQVDLAPGALLELVALARQAGAILLDNAAGG